MTIKDQNVLKAFHHHHLTTLEVTEHIHPIYGYAGCLFLIHAAIKHKIINSQEGKLIKEEMDKL